MPKQQLQDWRGGEGGGNILCFSKPASKSPDRAGVAARWKSQEVSSSNFALAMSSLEMMVRN